MSGRDGKHPSPFDSKSIPNPVPIEEGSNRSSSSNPRAGAYLVPAQRSTMTPPTSTELKIPVWRRTAQTPNPSADAQTEQAFSGTRSSASSESFRPMDSVRGVGFNFTAEEKVRAGFSWRYKGDITNPKNSSAGIRDDQNCAVFLTNLPTGTTEKILLDAMGIHAPFGRVYATSVAPAEHFWHPTTCAKVAMFDRQGAVALFNCVNARNLVIAGRTINITWNNNRTPVQTDLPSTASRILEILGPVEVVNFHRLSRFLEANIVFQTQDVTVVREDAEERLLQWTFCSFPAQAQVARKAPRAGWPGLHIRWETDPMSVSINRVPNIQSNMPPRPELEAAPAPSGSVSSVGDLITFSSEDEDGFGEEAYGSDAGSDIYGVNLAR